MKKLEKMEAILQAMRYKSKMGMCIDLKETDDEEKNGKMIEEYRNEN
jgi:hypothetical protein